MFTKDSEIVVRYAETDKMGIVHHAEFAIWFEVGRTDFIKGLGMKYSEIESRGVLIPLIEIKGNYKHPAKYEDVVIIRTIVKEFTSTRITFGYEAINKETNVLLATGETMHVFTNLQLKPINLRKNSPEIFEILSKSFE